MACRVKNLNEAPIAFTDLEFTGDVFSLHEIVEIGLVVVDQKNFKVLDELSVKVKPEHIETGLPVALAANGYNEEDWKKAISLKDAITQYADKTDGAIFCAYNATIDWGFMNEAFLRTGVGDKMDYHRLDVLSMAWAKLRDKDCMGWRLHQMAEYFGLPQEPSPHRAINGAKLALEVYKKLLNLQINL